MTGYVNMVLSRTWGYLNHRTAMLQAVAVNRYSNRLIFSHWNLASPSKRSLNSLVQTENKSSMTNTDQIHQVYEDPPKFKTMVFILNVRISSI